MIRKEVDEASPLLFNLLVNNETLENVKLEVMETGPQGPQRTVNTITLTNATVRSIWDDYSIPRKRVHRIELDFEDVSMFWPCRRWSNLSS